MLSSVSLPLELLRTRPHLLVACVVLFQAVLWLFVPLLFYTSPPGQVPQVLAEGHRAISMVTAGGPYGPPLAFWLAEIAFRAAGLFGVYLLSQLCVAVAFISVFMLGRAIVGASHAAMAVLAMAAMIVFAVPSPEFGPAVLSMPLWGLLLLHVWFAVWRERRLHWLGAGVMVGLLILTSYVNLWLLLLLAVYLACSEQGRAQLSFVEPSIGLFIALLLMFPHLVWLDRPGRAILWPAPGFSAYARNVGWLVSAIVLALLCLVVLGALMRDWQRRNGDVLTFERAPVDDHGRRFILIFALAPLLAIVFIPLMPGGMSMPAAAPLMLLATLAVVVALGNIIGVAYQNAMVWTWTALVVGPAVLIVGALIIGPRIGAAPYQVSLPSEAMGRYVAEAFERRTGRPLSIVTGDPQTAALIALGAPSRPSTFDAFQPRRTPSVTREDIERYGAVVVWIPASGRNAPSPEIAAQFPGLVLEVPQAFNRRLGGPAARLGWSVIRPKGIEPKAGESAK